MYGLSYVHVPKEKGKQQQALVSRWLDGVGCAKNGCRFVKNGCGMSETRCWASENGWVGCNGRKRVPMKKKVKQKKNSRTHVRILVHAFWNTNNRKKTAAALAAAAAAGTGGAGDVARKRGLGARKRGGWCR